MAISRYPNSFSYSKIGSLGFFHCSFGFNDFIHSLFFNKNCIFQNRYLGWFGVFNSLYYGMTYLTNAMDSLHAYNQLNPLSISMEEVTTSLNGSDQLHPEELKLIQGLNSGTKNIVYNHKKDILVNTAASALYLYSAFSAGYSLVKGDLINPISLVMNVGSITDSVVAGLKRI